MNPRLEKQLAGFLGKYSPEIEAQLIDARRRLREFFPRGYEQVFDNYNALVFGFSPSEKSSEAFISVAGYPKWVTLFFLNGVALKDPKKLLEGSGKQVRSIRLKSAEQLNSPDVEALIAQALSPHREALAAAPELSCAIKMVVEKQRPRRPQPKRSR